MWLEKGKKTGANHIAIIGTIHEILRYKTMLNEARGIGYGIFSNSRPQGEFLVMHV